MHKRNYTAISACVCVCARECFIFVFDMRDRKEENKKCGFVEESASCKEHQSASVLQ